MKHIQLYKITLSVSLTLNRDDLVLKPTGDIKPSSQTTTTPKPPPFPLIGSLFGYGAKPDPWINVEGHDLKTT